MKFYGTNLTADAILDCNKLQAEKIADRLAATGYNVAIADSSGNKVFVFTSSQGSTSTTYTS